MKSYTDIHVRIPLKVANTIKDGILKESIQYNSFLPSITKQSLNLNVSRDTIEKAYRILAKQGYIIPISGKGFLVKPPEERSKKILFVVNKLSSFKQEVFDSFVSSFDTDTKVYLLVHHYNPVYLYDILHNDQTVYDYYVIMPHFSINSSKKEWFSVLEQIPQKKLILIDKDVPELGKIHSSVYQDFENDIYHSLHSLGESLNKYKTVNLILQESSNHTSEIIKGVKKFVLEKGLKFSIFGDAKELNPVKKTLYVITEENDLAELLIKAKLKNLQIGIHFGVIAFNETPIKQLLDITVVSTDFISMGQSAAKNIMENRHLRIHNHFKVIVRSSI